MKKSVILWVLLTMFIVTGCSEGIIMIAEFTNVTPPEIKFDNRLYIMTEENVSSAKLSEQVGKVTQVHTVVSYLEEENPYKNPGKIYRVKGQKIQEAVAIEVNNKIYLAKVKKSSMDK